MNSISWMPEKRLIDIVTLVRWWRRFVCNSSCVDESLHALRLKKFEGRKKDEHFSTCEHLEIVNGVWKRCIDPSWQYFLGTYLLIRHMGTRKTRWLGLGLFSNQVKGGLACFNVLVHSPERDQWRSWSLREDGCEVDKGWSLDFKARQQVYIGLPFAKTFLA